MKLGSSLNRYHNQYLHKLLILYFLGFFIFVAYLVIVKLIYSVQACSFHIDNCNVF